MSIRVSTAGNVSIEFPDGTDQATVARVMRQASGPQAPAAPKRQDYGSVASPDYTHDLQRTFGQGVSLGFADEATAALGVNPTEYLGPQLPFTLARHAGLLPKRKESEATTYDERLAEEREGVARFSEKNPGTALAAEVAGGVAIPLAGWGGAARAAGRPLLSRALRGSVAGGSIGGTAGYGKGEGGFEQRLDNAGTYAKWGAGIGGAIPIAGAGVARGYEAARNWSPTLAARLPSFATGRSADQVADQVLAARMRRTGQTAGATADDFAGGARAATFGGANQNASRAQLPEMLADTSNDMQRLTGSVYRAGGEAGEVVKNALETRQRGVANPYATRPSGDIPRGQMEEIQDATERALRIRGQGSALQTERGILTNQAREGKKLYADAFANQQAFDLQPVLTGFALRIQQYPGAFAGKMQEALNQFVQPLRNFQGRFPPNTLERFDGAKKALDDLIERSEGNLRRELTQLKHELLDAVHAPNASGQPRNAGYRAAREVWGSAAENREAIGLGRAALRENSEVSVEQFQQLTRGQQQLFRIGLREGLKSAQGPARPGHDATKLFQERRVQDLLRAVIPNSRGAGEFADRSARFGEYLRRQARMGETRNAVLGNSKTAERSSDDAAFTGDALARFLGGGRALTNMGLEIVAATAQKAFGYRADVAAALARRLVETNPAQRLQILRNLRRRIAPSRFAQFMREIDRATVPFTQAIAGPNEAIAP